MKRKGYIGEGDVAALLKRYEASTILSLLYEISKCGTAKLNWEELVKDTNTGIKNAREYQALWKHLAYRKELDPPGEEFTLEDDDSDLEFEVETYPSISSEAAHEAANYVKTLLSFSSDMVFANSDSPGLGLTSTLPGFTSAQAASLESFYRANSQDKKRRKAWTAQEDDELAAGVEKYGEGNWASIVKLVFKNERTTSQLAQRWAMVKKRREVTFSQKQVDPEVLRRTKAALELAVCEQNVANGASSLLKQAQASLTRAEKAAALPLRKPVNPPIPKSNLSNLSSTPSLTPKPKPAPATLPATSNAQKPVPAPSTAQTTTSAPVKVGNVTTSTVRTGSVPVPPRSLQGPDPMVQAAAVAAGARIAPASAAANLMKAKNVVHIRPTASPSTKANATPARPSPVVHYIRTGSGAAPPLLQSLGKRSVKAVKGGAAVTPGSKLYLKPAGNAMSRLGVNSTKEELVETARLTPQKRKGVANNGMQCQTSLWYEMDDVVLDAKGSPLAVVDVDSDAEEQVLPSAAGGTVCTSSNESFNQTAFPVGALTLNGASPPSHSSGQSE